MHQCISLHYTEVPAQPWPALAEVWLPRLPRAKRAAILRLRAPADRNASLLGVALLATALGARAADLDSGALEYPVRGKPRLAAGPDFSIAHAAGRVACALADAGAVGLDLESRAAVAPRALRRALGAVEYARVVAGQTDATEAWVMTEAVLKAAGRGIGDAHLVRLWPRAATLEGVRYGLAPVAIDPAIVVWVAHAEGAAELRTSRHDAGIFAPLP